MNHFFANHAPNKPLIKDTFNGVTWFLLGTDGNGYASLAALQAAGVRAWPGLDPGGYVQTVSFRSEASTAGQDGSAFYVKVNTATQPTDAQGELIDSGMPGYVYAGNVFCVWLRKFAATDKIICQAAY